MKRTTGDRCADMHFDAKKSALSSRTIVRDSVLRLTKALDNFTSNLFTLLGPRSNESNEGASDAHSLFTPCLSFYLNSLFAVMHYLSPL